MQTYVLQFSRHVPFPHSTNICVHEHVCLYCVWAFAIYSMYVFTKKKHVLIRYLESIRQALQVLTLD
jgi:hypothetical protein